MPYKFLFLLSIFSIFNSSVFAQNEVTISGTVIEKTTKNSIPFANIILKTKQDDVFVTGTASNENGLFILENTKSGNYILEISSIGFITYKQTLFVGSLSNYLDIKTIELEEDVMALNEVIIETKQEEISTKMDKKPIHYKIISIKAVVQFYKRCKIYRV